MQDLNVASCYLQNHHRERMADFDRALLFLVTYALSQQGCFYVKNCNGFYNSPVGFESVYAYLCGSTDWWFSAPFQIMPRHMRT